MTSALEAVRVAAERVSPRTQRWFLFGPKFDSAFILGPMLAFACIAAFCLPRVEGQPFLAGMGTTPHWLALASAVLVFAHINATVSRSHLNQEVFRRFKLRLSLVPVLMVALFTTSNTVFFYASAAAILWDEYHSVMQTFGFGRIYDAKLGNDPHVGRRLDIGMCFVQEWVPYYIAISGFSLAENEHLTNVVPWHREHGLMAPQWMHAPLIAIAVGYTVFYIAAYVRLSRRGYRVSFAKIALYVSTAAANILALSIFTLYEANIMGNIYHAAMYLAVLWVSERKNLTQRLWLTNIKGGVYFAFAMLILFSIVTGFSRILTEREDVPVLMSFWLMTSLAHFWFDGFIWSVRRKEAV